MAADLGSNAFRPAVGLHTGRAQSVVLSLAQLVQHRDQILNDNHIPDRRLFFLSVGRVGVRLVRHFAGRLLSADASRHTWRSVMSILKRPSDFWRSRELYHQ